MQKDVPLNHDELRALTKRSNLRAGWMLAANWGLIIAAFTIAGLWPNPLTLLAAVLILGGRHLGLAVLMHECAHYSLFASRRLNVFVGRWLCAWPINYSYDAYRPYHLRHHAHAGTPKDPDLVLVQGYPVTKASLRRKLIRDLTGQTAIRDIIALWKRSDWQARTRMAAFQALLAVSLWAFGILWAISLWWIAYLCIFPILTRIRLIGEHGIAGDRLNPDVRINTATVYPNWLERLLIAPNNVSFHMEHHLIATVPAYRLRAMHRMLAERGFFKGHDTIVHGYKAVLRRAIR